MENKVLNLLVWLQAKGYPYTCKSYTLYTDIYAHAFLYILNTVYGLAYRNKMNAEDSMPYEVPCCIILLVINLFLFGSCNDLVQSDYDLLKLFHMFYCVYLKTFA